MIESKSKDEGTKERKRERKREKERERERKREKELGLSFSFSCLLQDSRFLILCHQEDEVEHLKHLLQHPHAVAKPFSQWKYDREGEREREREQTDRNKSNRFVRKFLHSSAFAFLPFGPAFLVFASHHSFRPLSIWGKA